MLRAAQSLTEHSFNLGDQLDSSFLMGGDGMDPVTHIFAFVVSKALCFLSESSLESCPSSSRMDSPPWFASVLLQEMHVRQRWLQIKT